MTSNILKPLKLRKSDLKEFDLFVSFIKISCTTKVENALLPEISDLVSMLIALLTETSLQQDK